MRDQNQDTLYGEQNTAGAPHWPPDHSRPPCPMRSGSHIRALDFPPCLTCNEDGGIDRKDFMVEEDQPLMCCISAEGPC